MGRLSKIINYRNISEGTKEFRRTDYWLVTISPPKGVYFPGNELIQVRTQSMSLDIDDEPQVESKKIRRFTVKQAIPADSTAGSATLTMIDRVDQTLSYYFEKLRLAVASKDVYGDGLPKELYYSPEVKAEYFDINENVIRTIRMIDCILVPGSLGTESGEADPALEETLELKIEFQHHKRDFENVDF